MFPTGKKLIKTAAIALLLTCGFSATASFALEAADQAKLTRTLNDSLRRMADNLHRETGKTLERTGVLELQNKDFYFSGLYPRLAVVDPDGSRLEIGQLSINATKASDENNWLLAYAVPSTIHKKRAGGQPEYQLTIGNQMFKAAYDGTRNLFLTGQSRYADIGFNYADGSKAHIDEITHNHDLSFDETGTKANGSVKLTVQNISYPTNLAAKDVMAPLFPVSARVNASVTNLPFEKLLAWSKSNTTDLALMQQQNSRSPLGFLTSLTQLQKILTASQTVQDIKELTLTGTNYEFGFIGTIEAKENAFYKYVLAGRVRFRGLDTMLAQLSALPVKTAADRARRDALQLTLETIKPYMVPVSGQTDSYTLEVIIDDKGKIILNGTDRTIELMGRALQGFLNKNQAANDSKKP